MGGDLIQWADADGDGILNGRANGSIVLVQAATFVDWSIAYSVAEAEAGDDLPLLVLSQPLQDFRRPAASAGLFFHASTVREPPACAADSPMFFHARTFWARSLRDATFIVAESRASGYHARQMKNPPNFYRGRFAPSPTGPLHFGSMVAAVGSYLDARAHGGEWLVRIEDIDAPRAVAGAADGILRTLEGFGFEWDGEVVYQSRRLDRYHAALSRLQLAGWVYPCSCSRNVIASSSARRSLDGSLVYPGTCRGGLPDGVAARAWRLRVPDREFVARDRVQGKACQNLEREVGDFVLLRADGQYAYQLAVVVDDAAQGINHVVRGADLLDSTARQVWLLQCLGCPAPSYAHLPVAVNRAGEKLSKQTRAPAVDPARGVGLLACVLRFLGQPVSAETEAMTLAEFWRWAIGAWDLSNVPAARAIPADPAASKFGYGEKRNSSKAEIAGSCQ